MHDLTITILCDNIDGSLKNFENDPGFSAVIRCGNKTILFDTGMYAHTLTHNLSVGGISQRDIDAVVLSHNHNDHTNGLPAVLKMNPEVPVYIHREWESGIPFEGMTVPVGNKRIAENPGTQHGLPDNVLLTGALHSSDYGGIREHAACILLDAAFILLCGCCHPGLVSFLDTRNELGIDPKLPFHIFGGMHGFSFTDKQAEHIKRNVLSVTLCHCTGHIDCFVRQFGSLCAAGVLGKTYSFR
ncbi:MAG: MBL fold metallo-hydrolase [Spirochaetales bacterium]|nr:MBL fold metallo-hydrolase [Spirochaetales bacterium]